MCLSFLFLRFASFVTITHTVVTVHASLAEAM